MITESQPSISRRGLLKWVGAGSVALAATGALSACSPAQGNLASTQGDAEVEPESNLQERYADLPVEESSAYAVIVGGVPAVFWPPTSWPRRAKRHCC